MTRMKTSKADQVPQRGLAQATEDNTAAFPEFSEAGTSQAELVSQNLARHNRPSLATSTKNISFFYNTLKEPPSERTIVVLGVERGGTSMAAGVVRALGVPMGKRAGLNHEDPQFLTEDRTQLTTRIAQRNREESVWGFKVPKASLHLDFYDQSLRNPYYVVVYRNPLAIMDSWQQRGAGSPLDVMDHILLYQSAVRDLCRRTRAPIMMLNYERAVQDAASINQMIEELAGFLGLSVTQDVRDRAVGMVTGDGSGYVNLPEHFFAVTRSELKSPEASPDDAVHFGPEIALVEEKDSIRDAAGWIDHVKQAPKLIVRLANGGNLPKAFWLVLDFDCEPDLDLSKLPIRVFFNFVGEFFPGHCDRPVIKSGRNLYFVETSGEAKALGFGPIAVPTRFRLTARMQGVAQSTQRPPEAEQPWHGASAEGRVVPRGTWNRFFRWLKRGIRVVR